MHETSLNHAELGELAKAVLRRGSVFRFTARGSSMCPFVREGDELTVEPLGRQSLGRGDVVLYRGDSGRLIVHRIVKSRDSEPAWLIRGDAALESSEWVRTDQLLGHVTRLKRHKEIIHLRRGPRQFAARLWHTFWPWSLRLYWIGGRIKGTGRKWLLAVRRNR